MCTGHGLAAYLRRPRGAQPLLSFLMSSTAPLSMFKVPAQTLFGTLTSLLAPLDPSESSGPPRFSVSKNYRQDGAKWQCGSMEWIFARR